MALPVSPKASPPDAVTSDACSIWLENSSKIAASSELDDHRIPAFQKRFFHPRFIVALLRLRFNSRKYASLGTNLMKQAACLRSIFLSARTSEVDNRDNNCRPGGCHNTGCTVYNRRIPPTPPSALPPVRPPSSDALPADLIRKRARPPSDSAMLLNVLPCRR